MQTRVTSSLVYPIGVQARVVRLPALGTAYAFGYGGPGHGLGFRPRPSLIVASPTLWRFSHFDRTPRSLQWRIPAMKKSTRSRKTRGITRRIRLTTKKRMRRRKKVRRVTECGALSVGVVLASLFSRSSSCHVSVRGFSSSIEVESRNWQKMSWWMIS